ncbi:MAG: hypothetical protein ACRDAU_05940 [Clostridium sp.]
MTTSLQSSSIIFFNVWWGESVEIRFDISTMELIATSKSINFSSKEETYFTFSLISPSQRKILYNQVASGLYTKPFVDSINNFPFNYGDIISLTTNGILKNPIISNGNNENLAQCNNSWGKGLAILIDESNASIPSSCTNIPEYFMITEQGLVRYIPSISIDFLNILGERTITRTTISGKAYKNSPVSITVDNKVFNGFTNTTGYFSIPISSLFGFTTLTKIIINIIGFETVVYPSFSNTKNIRLQTLSGFNYILNADLSVLTTPFNEHLYYGRSILSSHGKKAWDLAYSTLLKYDNSYNNYPRDSSGNTIVSIDYSTHNLNITATDAEMIQKYLVRNCPRMFHLKDWEATPIYKNNIIIGQNFYIGNGAENGNLYQTQLLQTENAATYILSKVQKNMSIYQIIQIIQIYYERMLSYEEIGDFEDIRGSLIAKKCVCGGYSKGFEYLLQRIGITNVWVQGFAGGGPHAWNFVNIYKKWFLSDTTWGGENWYLDGSDSKFTENHHVSNIYSPMPTLFRTSIPYNIGNYNNNPLDLLGTISYNRSSSSITIFYSDPRNLNTMISLNYFLDRWTSTRMYKSSNSNTWYVRIPFTKAFSKLYFYFTINFDYTTVGDIRTNNIKSTTLNNGITAATINL